MRQKKGIPVGNKGGIPYRRGRQIIKKTFASIIYLSVIPYMVFTIK